MPLPPGPLFPSEAQAKLDALGQAFKHWSALGQWARAQEPIAQALAWAPQHPHILGDAALCHLRLGQWAQAKALYLQAIALDANSPNLWDGLCESCGFLGDAQGVQSAGSQALARKDAETAGMPGRAVPSASPLSHERCRNVLAYSLFGAQPRYAEAALLNVAAAAQLLPQWVCRFYVDDSVPAHVLQRLQAAGAELVHMSADMAAGLSPLMWRFLAVADPGVDRFLMRDADSLVSTREQAAVQAWLDSGQTFHLMRDYFTHTELLLAGMWGGCTGAWPDIRALMQGFLREGQYLSARVADQHFLRRHIWPTVRQSLLSHDPVFRFRSGVDFPAHAPHGLGLDFHVGCNLSSGGIGAETALPDGSDIHWCFQDAGGQEIGRYTSRAQGGQWRADCPRPVLDKIRNGQWGVRVLG